MIVQDSLNLWAKVSKVNPEQEMRVLKMRIAEFDRDSVLSAAMNAFIDKGYSKTSMQDLKKATGLHPGSIYCAFENKRGLLIAALDHYGQQREAEFEALFSGQPTVLDGVKNYLSHIVDECEQECIQDCLLQKALSELARQDEQVERLIQSMLNQWQQLLEKKIALAQVQGELPEGKNSKYLAQYLVMGIYGIRTLSHTAPEPGSLRRLAGELLNHITEH